MSLDLLKSLLASEQAHVSDAFAVTESLCAAHDIESNDDEFAEFVAMSMAAQYDLERLADAERTSAIVIAAVDVVPGPALDEVAGRVQVPAPVSLGDIASFHVCDAKTLASTVSVPESFDAADLSWWAAQELQQLIHYIENEGDHHG